MTTEAWAIRSARPDDETAIVALWQECGLVVPWNDPVADFRRALGKSNSDVLVVSDKAGIDEAKLVVGAVMVGHDGHRGWIYYLAAAPAHRGRGIGAALVTTAETWLRARDIPKLQLMVRATNTAVLTFYEKVGFETVPLAVVQKWLKDSTG